MIYVITYVIIYVYLKNESEEIMRKKLLKSGNSLGVVLPPAYLELMGVNTKEYKNYSFDVSVDTAEKSIILKDKVVYYPCYANIICGLYKMIPTFISDAVQYVLCKYIYIMYSWICNKDIGEKKRTN